MQFVPYLMFNGNCAEALKFYEQCFGAKINCMTPFAGSPAEQFVAAEYRDQIMHASLSLGDAVVMASDSPPGECGGYEEPKGMSVAFQCSEPAEAERVFNMLAEGGKVQMPIAETFWASAFGMVVDRFGIPWMINCQKPEQPA